MKTSGNISDQAVLREKLEQLGLDMSAHTFAQVQRKVEMLEQQGWKFDSAEASLFLLVWKLLNRYRPWFELEHYSVLSRGRGTDSDGVFVGDDSSSVEASVKLRVNGKVWHTVREGNETAHAIELALRAALRPTYPRLDEMVVTDYGIHVFDREEGSPARVQVTLQSWDRHYDRSWGSVAVADDIVRAIWLALVDSMEFKRLLDSNDSCHFLVLCDCDGDRRLPDRAARQSEPPADRVLLDDHRE
jgi:2-isopropylmalate synthase